MGRTVAELKATLSAGELRNWIQFYRAEPWGSDFHRTCMIVSMIANVHRDPKRRRKAFEPGDFMPGFENAADKDGLNPKRIRKELQAVFGSRIKYAGNHQH